MTAFPHLTERGRALVAQAQLAAQLRETLAACDASRASSWGALATLLEGVPTEQRQADEVAAAWQEFHDVRAATEAAVQAALDKGRSTRLPAGGWTHEGMGTEALRGALAELEGFPRMSDAGRELAGRGVRIIMIRQALLQALPQTSLEGAASWVPLAEVLEADRAKPAFAAASNRANDEVRARRQAHATAACACDAACTSHGHAHP